MSKKLTLDSFLNRASSVHEDKYDYSKVNYENYHEKVEIICKIHGSFKQRPSKHLAGQGCPKCGIIKYTTSQITPFKKVKEKFVKIHKGIYKYVEESYTKSKVKMQIVCQKHGVFMQTPEQHLRGYGCPKCAKNGTFDMDGYSLLYYVSINNGEYYKIGVTNNTVKNRFKKDIHVSVQLIHQWFYFVGEQAYRKEQEIMKEFSDKLAKNIKILRTGNSEIFIEDVLNLDKLKGN